MPSLLDVHVHHFPEAARRDPAAWGRARHEPHWVQLVTAGPQGWATDAELIAALDAVSPDACAVLQGWYWEQAATCLEQNAFLLETARRSGGRLRVAVSVQPAAGVNTCRQALEAADAAGACGIGELHPVAQGFSFEDAAWSAICAFARQRNWPITLHVTEPVGHQYTGRVETPLEAYVAMAERFPDNRFIFAHWGGGLPFYCLNRRVAKALKNVWFDTAASPLLYHASVWEMVTAGIGASKILFGSDYPLRLYPRQEAQPSIRSLYQELQGTALSTPARSRICSENAAELFSFSHPPLSPR